MKLSCYNSPEQCDQRMVWLDAQIEIAQAKAIDPTEPNREKFQNRARNLSHNRRQLIRRRDLLLTPELL